MLGRKPSALVFKIGNFASLDPEMKRRGVGGLPNTSKLDKQVWEEFDADWSKMTLESAELIAQFKDQPVEVAVEIDVSDLPKGEDKLRMVKTRVCQSFFRNAVLVAYDNLCCITGLAMPDLHTTNPQNGLCLNALHDRAFDKGLITVLPDFTVRVSKHLDEVESKEAIEKYFLAYNNRPIIQPGRSLPKREFLEYHNDVIFRK
jgi:putative restriction endonuclease